MLPSVTLAHKGLSPSGKRTLADGLLLIQIKIAYLKFFKSLQQVCAHAHAGHTQCIYKIGMIVVNRQSVVVQNLCIFLSSNSLSSIN